MGVYDAQSVFDGGARFEPDAVLLDIGMPQMTGYDIARELRRTRGNDLLLDRRHRLEQVLRQDGGAISPASTTMSPSPQGGGDLELLTPLAGQIADCNHRTSRSRARLLHRNGRA
jgi:PleD family two-component response regulator